MTRETKVGLLIGLGVILLIGIIISDHLAVMKERHPEGETAMADFADQAQESVEGQPVMNRAPAGGRQARSGNGRQPLPTPSELGGRQQRSDGRGAASRDQANREGSGSPVAGTQRPPSQAFAIHDQPGLAGGRVPGGQMMPSGGTDEPEQTGGSSGGVSARADRASGGRPGDRPAERGQEVRSSQGDEAGPQAGDVDAPSERAGSRRGEAEPDSGERDPLRHVVEPGQSVYEIAQRYYDNGRYWESIQQANPDKVSEDGTVVPGAALTIPDRAGRANRGAGSDRSRMQQLAQAAETGTITVQRGATLRALARAYLNDAGKWRRFLEVNPELDSSGDLQAGMELSLPPEVTEPVANQPEPIEDPGQGSAGDSSYTVQSGDTLYGIAEKTLGDGGQWERIFEANGDKLDDSDDLEVGMALTIPQ